MAYDPSLGYDPDNIADSINKAAARGDDAEVERLAVIRYNTKVKDNPTMSKYENDAYSQIAKSALRRSGEAVQPEPVAQAAPQQAQSFSDVMSWIDALNAESKKQSVANLQAARDNALSSLDREQSTIAPTYYNQRNDLAAAGTQSEKTLAEYLAQNGLAGSGAVGELQGRNMVATNSNIAANKLAENSAIEDILRRRTDVQREYDTGVASANSAAEVARIQALISQANSDRQYALQEAGYTGTLNGAQTLQGASAQREADAYATEKANAALQREIDTIDQYSTDFMSEINRRKNTPDTADDALIPYLTIARNAKMAAQNSAASESAKAQYDSAMEMFKQLGYASGWVAQALGLPEGAKSADYLETLYSINKPYYAPPTKEPDKTINDLGTPEQVNQYYETLNSFITGDVGKNSPEAAYSAALSNRGSLVNIMGDALAEKLLGDLKTRASVVGEAKVETPVEESDIAGVLSDFNAAPDKKAWYIQYYGSLTKDERDVIDKEYSRYRADND